MKFAKYLQDEVVPEWRKAYINYKQGKKHLKAIERVLDELDLEAAQAFEAHEAHEALQDTLSPLPTFIQHPHPHSPPPTTTPPTTTESDSTASTPIMSRRRGSGRNYSSINFLPPLGTSTTNTNTNSSRGPLSEEDEGRSALGGRTLNGEGDGGDEESATTVRPKKEFDGLRQSLGSTAFQFGQTARSQSSQLLKNLSRRFTIIGPSEIPVRVRSIQIDDNSIDNILDQLLPEEQTFFNFLDSQLELVNSFYQEKELEAVTKLKVIQQQLFVASQWKRRYDDHMARAKAEHGWYAAEWSRVRKGFDNLIRVDTAVTEDVTLGSKKSGLTPVGTFNGGQGGKLDSERMLHHRGLGRPSDNRFEANHKAGLDAHALAHQEELELQEEEDRRQYLNHKVARTRIKAALYEFYRSLEMIKNYKVLNHTGFAKILKKFDKTAGWKGSKPYINSRLKPAYFMTSGVIEDLIKETEDLFIETFEKGHRRRGMAKLRIPDSKNQTHHFTTTRIGMYMGLAAPLMFQALQAAFSSETPAEVPYWDGLLLVYAGLFLTFLFACLFGINMYVWAKARINYKFIFEFDPRDNLDYHEYFELPILLILLLTLAVYLDFGSKLTQHVATAYWPLILMSITVAIIFCPLPIAHFTARRWFISSIGRILASGYYRVEFRDFFLADEMNSLSYSIEQFEFAMCAYSEQWEDLANQCSTSHMWITPFLTALPAWFRFLQCLRRYRDTLEWFPHLVNAGKYSASLINLFVYFSFRHYGGAQLKIAWIFVSTITSCYTFGWDIYMDWGLFRFGKNGGGANGHPFLRQELVYSRTWVYYMAIALDFVGRFSWTVRLIPMNINVMVLSFALAFLEVLRRWQWNFFRLENEHLNNCGQFRAIKDIPLPFHIRVQGESDDEDDEDDNSDNNRSSNQQYPHEDPDFVVHQEGVFHLHDGDQELEDRDQHGHFVDRDSIFPQMSLASSSPRRSGFGVGGGGGGLVRSSSSQSSFFGAFSNGSHAHGLSNLGSSIGGGVGTGDADGGGAGDVEVAGQNREASKSRTSLHSATSLSQPRRPYGGVTQRSFSHSSTTQGTAGGGGGEMASLRTKQSMASLKTKRSRASLHDSVTAGAAVSNTSLHQPFSTSRSNSFVDNAVAEAGFTGSQREILEAETASSKKFYDRRDFDSKIIEVESNSDLWRRQPRAPKERAMTGGATSLHGLQALSADGVLGGGGGGLDERILDSERRARSQVVVPRRKMSMGTRMRNSIFGRGRGQSSDSEDDEEADTE